jgi:CxxC motif-containing protein (DUF1111 family)
MHATLRHGWILGAVGIAAAIAGCSEASGREKASSTISPQSAKPAISSAGVDPGPRGGAAGAGGFFASLSAVEQAQFSAALDSFNEIDSVTGSIGGESGKGLGPTFNGNSCAMCHAQPSAGGSSPGLRSPQHPVPNPQVALATLDGATNSVPPFITPDGPVREARFIAVSSDNNAPLDGGVHGLFTIAGRRDAPGCTLAQPDFATQLANNNVIFRIPTPLFGLGLVESTPDAALQANLATNGAAKAALGIAGRFNTSGNDGTITRFGWKAQNKSLLVFVGEAYNVEQGVSNEGFANERSAVPGCVFNPSPEDYTVPGGGNSDITNFAIFSRLLAPPTPGASSLSASNGQRLFNSIGCALCHSPNLTTGASQYTGMSNVTYHPYSDFALHHMGANLADGISQGAAVADEFRTAPLWGVGQRLFFLHDGRTSDLGEAIEAHANLGGLDQVTTQDYEQFNANGVWYQPFTQTQTPGSEAQAVVDRFNALSAQQQTDLLTFLRSL